jgi:K+/H+ antiporter YhaU regulatory subunit KhtT
MMVSTTRRLHGVTYESESPVYSRVALDIAGRIANGGIAEGSRLSGRSDLSGGYKVSPETIRRAISLLEEMEIVVAVKGSGIQILSAEKAKRYIERSNERETVHSLRVGIREMNEEKRRIEDRIFEMTDRIAEYAERMRHVQAVYPMEFDVPAGSPVIGRTFGEMRFWQNTGGTIVALRRHGSFMISPGPFAVFEPHDVVYIVGPPEIAERVRNLFTKGIEEWRTP